MRVPKAVGSSAAEALAKATTDVIVSGAPDELAEEGTAFDAISKSRLGSLVDEGLFRMIFEELKSRGLAKESEDGVSIPMHPKVRILILVLLSQILWPYGTNINANLSRATDMGSMVNALSKLLSRGRAILRNRDRIRSHDRDSRSSLGAPR